MHAHLGMDEKKKMRRKLIRFASRGSICASTIPYCNKHLLLFFEDLFVRRNNNNNIPFRFGNDIDN